MAHKDIITSRYWNTNGQQVAVVAVEGGAHDVAAYIGGTCGYTKEGDTLVWVVNHGAKLGSADAHRMLPRLRCRMQEFNLTYRE